MDSSRLWTTRGPGSELLGAEAASARGAASSTHIRIAARPTLVPLPSEAASPRPADHAASSGRPGVALPLPASSAARVGRQDCIVVAYHHRHSAQDGAAGPAPPGHGTAQRALAGRTAARVGDAAVALPSAHGLEALGEQVVPLLSAAAPRGLAAPVAASDTVPPGDDSAGIGAGSHRLLAGACTLARVLQSSMRRYCRAEMFDAASDRSVFAELPMRSALRELRLSHARRIARLEWAAVRGAIGRPRRFSAAFAREERARLSDARTNIALAQRACPPVPTASGPLLAAVPAPALPGDVVSAVHPRTGLPELAVVVAAHPVRRAVAIRFLAAGRGRPVEVAEPDVFPVGPARELHPAVRPALMPTVVVSRVPGDGPGPDGAPAQGDGGGADEGRQAASVSLVAVVEPNAEGWGPSLGRRSGRSASPRRDGRTAASHGLRLPREGCLRGWEREMRGTAVSLVRRIRWCVARQAALLRAMGASRREEAPPLEPATTRWVRAELEAMSVALDTACASLRRVRRALLALRAGPSGVRDDEQPRAEACRGSSRAAVHGSAREPGATRPATVSCAAAGEAPGSEPRTDTPLLLRGPGAGAGLWRAAQEVSPWPAAPDGQQRPDDGRAGRGSPGRPDAAWSRPSALATSVVSGARAGCRRALTDLVDASGRTCGVVMGRQATASKRSVGSAFAALFDGVERPRNPLVAVPDDSSAQQRSPKRLRAAAADGLEHAQRKRRAAAARDAALGATAAINAPSVLAPVAQAAGCPSAESLLRGQYSAAALNATAMLEVLCWQAIRRSSSQASRQATLQCCASLLPRHEENMEAWNNLVSAVASVQALSFEASACAPPSE
ncbi:ALY1 [Symbiodinium sp. KB8]|nr:ALY1 [Symbiodinium sp. KB8]